VFVEDTIARRAQLLANTGSRSCTFARTLETKLSTTVSALEWLGQQLESLRNQLESSEMALHDYRPAQQSPERFVRRSSQSYRQPDRAPLEQASRPHRSANCNRRACRELRRAASATDPLDQTAPELLTSASYSTCAESTKKRDAIATCSRARYGERSTQILGAEASLAELTDAMRSEVRSIFGRRGGTADVASNRVRPPECSRRGATRGTRAESSGNSSTGGSRASARTTPSSMVSFSNGPRRPTSRDCFA